MHRAGNGGASADLRITEIQALAGSVKAEEVVMYRATEFSFCHATKGWLAHYEQTTSKKKRPFAGPP